MKRGSKGATIVDDVAEVAEVTREEEQDSNVMQDDVDNEVEI